MVLQPPLTPDGADPKDGPVAAGAPGGADPEDGPEERTEAVPGQCLFCEIVAGRVPATVVLDEPEAVAFLDHRPVFEGHCLLVPREHHDNLVAMPEDEVGTLFRAARRLARAVETGLGADGTFVAINNTVSQSVPHLHVHVVPRHRGDGLRGFFWPRRRYPDDAAMEAVAQRIRAAL